jgi:glycosyltransferase involved in cell wall biosynthesis
MADASPTVSIVIKALNEERHIADAIENALAALDGMSGEVILADSASTDRTIEIASHYPIKIVTLSRIEDRSCGAGTQLAYQYSSGRFVCLIDGDMRLHREFLVPAIAFLHSNREFAGVGGIIIERETENFEYVKRAAAQDPGRRPGEVSRLDCGGVYRREAIESVGYLGDRNLHSAEEFELGARLCARGWKLARIDVPAIDHFGHTGNAYAMLRRRWATGYAFGTGEILRAALSQNRIGFVVARLRRELFLLSAVHVWWLALIAAPILIRGFIPAAAAIATLFLLPFLAMSLRCRSIALGIYSVVAWNVYAAGIWPGLLRKRIDPAEWIDSAVIREAPDTRLSAEPTAGGVLNNLVTPSGAK